MTTDPGLSEMQSELPFGTLGHFVVGAFVALVVREVLVIPAAVLSGTGGWMDIGPALGWSLGFAVGGGYYGYAVRRSSPFFLAIVLYLLIVPLQAAMNASFKIMDSGTEWRITPELVWQIASPLAFAVVGVVAGKVLRAHFAKGTAAKKKEPNLLLRTLWVFFLGIVAADAVLLAGFIAFYIPMVILNMVYPGSISIMPVPGTEPAAWAPLDFLWWPVFGTLGTLSFLATGFVYGYMIERRLAYLLACIWGGVVVSVIMIVGIATGFLLYVLFSVLPIPSTIYGVILGCRFRLRQNRVK